MDARVSDRPAPRRAAGPRTLGVVALVLAVATALLALGLLGAAAALYATIERATSISAGEGPSLTADQERVSTLVLSLKSWAIVGSLLLGFMTFTFGTVAAGLDRGRRLAVAALVLLAVTAVASTLILLWGFPLDPCLGGVTCAAGR